MELEPILEEGTKSFSRLNIDKKTRRREEILNFPNLEP